MADGGHDAEVERLRRRLLRDARLFDDPASYAAGVHDAIDAVIELEVADADRDVLTSPGTGNR